MSYQLSLSHPLSSGKRLVRCFIAATLACQFMTNTTMAESWGRGANITTAREQSTGLDTALREEPAPGVVSSKSPVADSALVGRTGGGSRLTDNTLAASAAAERAIEARGGAEASSTWPDVNSTPVTTAEFAASLEYDILSARLNGDLTLANALSQSLQAKESTQLMGLALEIDNLATDLSWDTGNTQYDARIRTLASTLIEHCKRKFDRVPAIEAFHCGRGHFALSFLSGVRGSYYQAGVNGTQAIRAFESALERTPDQVAIKLPLGMAYYYADHLPSFVKMVAPLLWFIPSGSSHKSLPYLRDVTEVEGPYQDAALFVLGDLLIQSPTHQGSAWEYFEPLAKRYPANPRIHLALIGGFVVGDDWERAEEAVNTMLAHVPSDKTAHRLLADMWWVYARWHQGKSIGEGATSRLQAATLTEQPQWVQTCFELAQALATEAAGDVKDAIAIYQTISERDRWDAWPWLTELATERLIALQ